MPCAGSLPVELLAPVREIAAAMTRQPPDQDTLSGVHNPFGHHACVAQAWSFLDIAESRQLLDGVEDVMGPDIILWDSELYPCRLSLPSDEAMCWPVDPLAGTIVLVSLERAEFGLIDIAKLPEALTDFDMGGATLAMRYMPATSHFNRDQSFPANRHVTEVRPLVNYAKRPIWLVRGEDRANNDLAAGFMVPASRWTGAIPGDPMRGNDTRLSR